MKEIYDRRSIRRFLDKPIPKETIKEIIMAGIQAPSYCNTQQWRFAILNDSQKKKIVDMGGADFIKKSPVAIIVTYPKSDNDYRDDIQTSAACIQNMLLKATQLKIGSCWVCHLPSKKRVRQLLNIPNSYEIVSCVVLGHPLKKSYPVKRRFEYNDLFTFDKPKKTFRDKAKALYLKQPIRPKIIEKKYTKRFRN